jgi:hypothetical protein
MAVLFDAFSESHTGTSGSASQASFSWTHTPVGTPAGVLVFVATNANSALITSVTYGGVAMTAVSGGEAIDTGGEPGRMTAYFLATGIPTGARTVTVTRTNNTTVMYAVAITVTADSTPEVYEAGIVLLENDGTLAVQAVDDGSPGTNSLRFAAINSGLSSVPAAGTGSTVLGGVDFGARVVQVVRETTGGEGSRDVGFSSATSDDRAAVHLAVREAPAPPASSWYFGQRFFGAAFFAATYFANGGGGGVGSYVDLTPVGVEATAEAGEVSVNPIPSTYFPPSYYPGRYYARRYFGGETESVNFTITGVEGTAELGPPSLNLPTTEGGYFSTVYFGNEFFAPRYFSQIAGETILIVYPDGVEGLFEVNDISYGDFIEDATGLEGLGELGTPMPTPDLAATGVEGAAEWGASPLQLAPDIVGLEAQAQQGFLTLDFSSLVSLTITGLEATGEVGTTERLADMVPGGVESLGEVGQGILVAVVPMPSVEGTAEVGTSDVAVALAPTGLEGTAQVQGPNVDAVNTSQTFSPTGVEDAAEVGEAALTLDELPTGVEGTSELGTPTLTYGTVSTIVTPRTWLLVRPPSFPTIARLRS